MDLILRLFFLFSLFLSYASATCPLNFNILSNFSQNAFFSGNVSEQCQQARQDLHLVLSEYLRTNGSFLPPANASKDCWDAFQAEITSFGSNFDVRSACGYDNSSISRGCLNITTRQQFEFQVPSATRNTMESACNQSLGGSACTGCSATLSSSPTIYLRENSTFISNLTDCTVYPSIYAAAILNPGGPLDPNTANCLFFLNTVSNSGKNHAWAYGAAAAGISVSIALGLLGFWYWRRREARKKKILAERLEGLGSEPSSMNPNSTLVRFKIDEIRAATKNFSRENIIGSGGFGNVYKGVLSDGSVVAVKRFKNCSPAGDEGFVHEVQVISSIRHRNLVALRGFCTSPGSLEGHQRIIVCEFMPNGSLHDHLFGCWAHRRLDWRSRCRIAVGMARGLAYLHRDVQPAIIHRDIKASNILLDENFEAKVADFGLAKFTPEGVTHVSTRVAGTHGYVAPEYALYGQLTEKSDVYSFGVVLLELLSGKKALFTTGQAQPLHITDWAWSLARKGSTLEVIEQDMENPGPADVIERYVMIALLCAHPQLHCRPSIDQALKIIESDLPVPQIPDRPLPLIADLEDIERTASAGGSGRLSSRSGYQSFSTEKSSEARGDSQHG
uniref:non-specific serine/threonine protein kinase n=1 Tax=Araucaria cunninghamii TaxID=56994 RepID=A0A0D6QRH3_ARACU